MPIIEVGEFIKIAKNNDTDTIKGWGTWKAAIDALIIYSSD